MTARSPGTPLAGGERYPRSPLGEGTGDGVPTGRDVEWEPLIDYPGSAVDQ